MRYALSENFPSEKQTNQATLFLNDLKHVLAVLQCCFFFFIKLPAAAENDAMRAARLNQNKEHVKLTMKLKLRGAVDSSDHQAGSSL